MTPKDPPRAAALFAAALVAAAALSLGGCWTAPTQPILGYETSDQACSDGIDNDYDGLIDCQDRDCIAASTVCGEFVPFLPPNPIPERVYVDKNNKKAVISLCTDGIDNDGDGQFDCGDRKCRAVAELCCSTENNNKACSDGIDNDGNGFADCADFSCRNGLFVTVCDGTSPATPENCSNKQDDDGDGAVDCFDSDCSKDPACQPDNKPEDTLARCKDGIDNDGNKYTDCADFSCSKSSDPAIVAYCASLPKENTLATCSDGKDNDNNGYTDCNDFSCSRSQDPGIARHCADSAEDTPEKCSDGKDNNGNGYIDCNDFSCSRSTNPEVIKVCQKQLENTEEACTDGKDNDNNGYIDCGDRGCWPLKVCVGKVENTVAACSDGIDNDGNGYTDCADNGCAKSKDVLVRKACQESYTDPALDLATQKADADKACSNGDDDDNDGFVDCADWDCSHNPLVSVCKGKPLVCAPGVRK